MDSPDGRAFLAFLRLAVNHEDSLAWRTLFQVWCDGIGPGAIGAIYDIARSQGMSFAQVILAANDNAGILPSNHQSRLSVAISNVLTRLETTFPEESGQVFDTGDALMEFLCVAARRLIRNKHSRDAILQNMEQIVEAVEALSIEDAVRGREVISEDIEQELAEDSVNILTMHRAKGLTAEAVIIAAAEDQYIPGRAVGQAIDDERRLLYVSLTRARHHLFVTYCDRRNGSQRYTGRDSGRASRSLSRFLIDSPHSPRSGQTFIDRLAREHR